MIAPNPPPAYDPGCRTCRSLTGEARISPGPAIYEGQGWVVEHAYPVAHPGWLVLVLRRHAAALHDLTPAELAELGALQARTVQALRRHFACEKEYLACFAEAPGFQHVHVHVVQIPADLPPSSRGPGIFSLLKPPPDQVLPPTTIQAVCDALWAVFAATD